MKRQRPTLPLRGRVTVPGDKSISHRALLLAALARGRSRLTGLNSGADVAATAALVEALGVGSGLDTKGRVEVDSGGPSAWREPPRVVDCGNSGTTMRLGLGLCARGPGLTILTGDDSLSDRPMLRAVVPLRQLGARIDGRRHGDRPPLVVRGTDLEGAEVRGSVASAQVKSAVLLAGLGAAGRTVYEEPVPTRDHTERMLAAAGVELERDERRVGVTGGGTVAPLALHVPGDLSSALYLVVAAGLIEGSDLVVEGVGLNPTRSGALDVLKRMGADLEVDVQEVRAGEPVGSIRVRSSPLRGVTIGPQEVPGLIDELPILAVAAARAEGRTVVSGAAELRVKESDRIESIVAGLRALRATADTRPDGFLIAGPTELQGGEVESRGDHRVALAFAVAGLVAAQRVRVRGWSCVETSFPEFLDILGDAQGRT